MESGEGEFKKSRVCVLCDQNAPRGQWRLGRMVEVTQVRMDRCVLSKWAQGVSRMSPSETTAPVELRWSARVCDINGNWNKSNKEFCEHMEKCL